MAINVITISLADFDENAQKASEIATTVSNVWVDLKSIKSSLSSEVLAKSNISSSLTTILSEIVDCQVNLEKTSEFLTLASSSYSQAETELTYLSNIGYQEESDSSFFTNANTVLSKYGIAGSSISIALSPIATWLDTGSFVDDDSPVQNFVDSLGMCVTAGSNLYEYFYSNKSIWNLDKIVTGDSISSSYINSIDSQFSKYTTGGATSVFAYASLAVTVAGNAIGNYEEYQSGEISTVRAVEETIMETAIDVGVSALVQAGVSAVVGTAAVAVSAPAVAVVAVAAVATIGVNMALDYVVGGDFTEIASDCILDAGEAAVEVVGEAVSIAVDAVSSAASSAWSGLKSLFS